MICWRSALDEVISLCIYHSDSYNKMKAEYDMWSERYGDISWRNYLRKLLSLSETGQWVKDVAEVELRILSDSDGNKEKNR